MKNSVVSVERLAQAVSKGMQGGADDGFGGLKTNPLRTVHRKAVRLLINSAEILLKPQRTAEIDPVIGREKEIQRVIQILSRRTKNNPVLIGEPGVGKTAVAEGLALEIARAMCLKFLKTSELSALTSQVW